MAPEFEGIIKCSKTDNDAYQKSPGEGTWVYAYLMSLTIFKQLSTAASDARLKTLHDLRRPVSTTLPETLTRTWSAHPSPRMTRNQIVASTILLQHVCFVLSNIWCSSIKIPSEFSTNFPKTQLNILQSYYDCPTERFSESDSRRLALLHV